MKLKPTKNKTPAMRKFSGTVHYEGCFNYTVMARDEDEARLLMEAKFAQEKPEALEDNLADFTVDSCFEGEWK